MVPFEILVELMLNGAWTDISSDVYEKDTIRITRGRSAEGQRVDHGRCFFTLNNRDGKYTPRNPMSPYYGQIGRNTPVRLSVAAGDSYLALTGSTTGYASTPDTAALDITGDLDVRIEAALDNWQQAGPVIELAGRYVTSGDNRSWYFRMQSGYPGLAWSPDGTLASLITVNATEPILFPTSNRIALRATLDVNNTAGGYEVRFYTADSITGTWFQLGDPVVGVGTTSIHAGTAPLEVGTVTLVSGEPSSGRIYGFRLFNGINGSQAAYIDFTAQTPGDTNFTGGDGLTWTLQGDASIANRMVRFVGEISSWPLRWDTGGNDVHVQIEAAGILRRLGQGAAPFQSTLRRRIPSDPTLIAYWPMEDESSATQAASALPTSRPINTAGFDFASIDTLAGSSALPTLDSSAGLPTFTGYVPYSAPGQWQVEFLYYRETPDATMWTHMRILASGTVREWYLQMSSTGGRIIGKDGDDTTILTDPFVWTSVVPFGSWYRMRFSVTTDGPNIDYTLSWIRVAAAAIEWTGTVAGSPGRVLGVASPPDGFAAALNGMAIGHIAVFNTPGSTIFNYADTGYDGETAGARIKRLAAEENIALWLHGSTPRQERMGAQPQAELLDLLHQCADADQGIVYEEREAVALAYRDRVSLYNQQVALTLDYSGGDGLVTPLDPIDDDQHLRNDVTVTRTGGSSAQVTQMEGPLSILPPPAGVGPYPDAVTLNLYRDEQAEHAAGWLVHLGTWDETRYPVVKVLLQKAPHLIETATAVDSGSRIQIANPPAWLPPDRIDLLAQGSVELLHQFRWELEFNCTPAGPWTIAVTDNPVLGRAGSAAAELAAPVTAGAGTLYVATGEDHAPWVEDPASLPVNIRVGGEVMTVSAAGPSLHDAFARTLASQWGPADVGGTWSISGGTAADYNVGSGYGWHTLATTATSRRSSVAAPTDDFDMYADIAVSAVATGGGLFGGLMARAADANNLYQARLEFTTASGLVLTIQERAGGGESTLGTYAVPFGYTAGGFIRMRFKGDGSRLRAKVWQTTAQEPAAWQVDVTDATLTAGALIGTRSVSAGGNTNVNPQVRYTNLRVSPQALTVARSVNSIVKAHSTGTPVALAIPATVAL